MLRPSLLLLVPHLLALVASAAALSGDLPAFTNNAVVRTIDLGGSTTQVTTTYTAKALDSANEYIVSLGEEEDSHLGWFEAKDKKSSAPLEWRRGEYYEPSRSYLYHITLPSPLAADESITLTTVAVLTGSSRALPASIQQGEEQFLLWRGDVGVKSIFDTDVARVKIRAPTTTILSHSPAPEEYTRDSAVTKSGSTTTLGPYYNVPALASVGENFEIHYKYDQPVITVASLKRHVEVSHWGSNLNVEDKISLVNTGPTLKGHFARITHQQAKHFRRPTPQTLSDVTLRLPPSIHSPYFYDTIGNVSTSHFRPSVPPPAMTVKRRQQAIKEESILELRPRYPILGGWSYNFTVGWDAPLEKSVHRTQDGSYILAVPFITGMADVAVENVDFVVVLPEGATDITLEAPFRIPTPEHFIHTTYLDTLGRPALRIRKARCTEKCGDGFVYVKYSLSPLAHFQKPIAGAAAVFAIFAATMGLKRALA